MNRRGIDAKPEHSQRYERVLSFGPCFQMMQLIPNLSGLSGRLLAVRSARVSCFQFPGENARVRLSHRSSFPHTQPLAWPREIVIEKETSFRCHVALDAFQLSCLRNNQITRFPLANRTQSPKCNVLRLDFNIFILMVRYELTGHNSSCRLNRERTNDLAQ